MHAIRPFSLLHGPRRPEQQDWTCFSRNRDAKRRWRTVHYFAECCRLHGWLAQGEGELKIMERMMRPWPAAVGASSESHLVVGADSDITLMALICPLGPSIAVLPDVRPHDERIYPFQPLAGSHTQQAHALQWISWSTAVPACVQVITSTLCGITNGLGVKVSAVVVLWHHLCRRVFDQSAEVPDTALSDAVEVSKGRAHGVLGGCAARAVVQGGQRRGQRLSWWSRRLCPGSGQDHGCCTALPCAPCSVPRPS